MQVGGKNESWTFISISVILESGAGLGGDPVGDVTCKPTPMPTYKTTQRWWLCIISVAGDVVSRRHESDF
jgi:hypothetical protein